VGSWECRKIWGRDGTIKDCGQLSACGRQLAAFGDQNSTQHSGRISEEKHSELI